ncbi:MAG: putative CocE/NonD family hydrolase [Planctomycetota bacterium]|jgi:putative CocE/NonD family hydrolase
MSSLSLGAALLILTSTLGLAQDAAPTKISEFGRYEGWSVERFDGWSASSEYVEMRDGVRLAVDVVRPSSAGEVSQERLPVVWTHSRYHRSPQTLIEKFNPGASIEIDSSVDVDASLQRLVKHGYVVCAVGVRGSGASFGRFEGLFSESETKDAEEIINWLAEQPWSDGNVGMYGGSYLGITQFMAASVKPAALKAIIPDVAAFDMYDLVYPGGVMRADMIEHWDWLTDQLDMEWIAPAVDGDEGGLLLKEAVAGHAQNWQVLDGYRSAPFRDDKVPGLDWSTHGPSGVLAEVQAAAVPCYHWGAFYDCFAMDTCLMFANYRGPQHMVMAPWAHAGMPEMIYQVERGRLTTIERHRWFDRYLKGIPNGIDEQPRVQYAVTEKPGTWHWMSAESWPPKGLDSKYLWFAGGQSGTLESVNDGVLANSPPHELAAFDVYEIDASTTTGTSTRWDNAVGATPRMSYADLGSNDAKCLTYTSAPLDEALTVVGHPIVTLHVTAEAGDADFVVLLEEVHADGFVEYVSEGVLRASNRQLMDAPYENLGLPWQRCAESDGVPLPAGVPAALLLDLQPLANEFDAGSRIRVVIMCADADNLEVATESGQVSVFRNAAYASGIRLPVLPR